MRSLLITLLLLLTSIVFAQKNHTDSLAEFNQIVKTITTTNNDTVRLNALYNAHYYQQLLIGELNKENTKKFNLTYVKQGIALATKLKSFYKLKTLTTDIGYIFDLGKNYDSSFAYYSNCLDVLEQANNNELTVSLSQSILYNRSIIQNEIDSESKMVREQEDKIKKLIAFALLALVIALFSLLFFTQKIKKNNSVLLLQKEVIHKSKKEIDSSINYAQGIQQALLANENKLSAMFKQSFVLFMPKDKVSGDFLWTHSCTNFDYVAIADCTGHGVPGAMLSIIGHFLLDAVMTKDGCTTPSQILTELHASMVEALNQNDISNANKIEGMDIGIICINKQRSKVTFSGAHRSLYHYRGDILTEIKGIKRPIGGTQVIYNTMFEDVELLIKPNDTLYSFSDGYQDQSGGEKNKRFMSKNLIKLLAKIQNSDFSTQQSILKTTFTAYMGNNEQRDDVLLVGIKI
jgi:serine phosphatase RsbU (regulator of sigma subunit)